MYCELKAYYAHYDFGNLGNLNNYGQSTPPLYDASKVTAPQITFWGDNDWLADPVVCLHYHLISKYPLTFLYNFLKGCGLGRSSVSQFGAERPHSPLQSFGFSLGSSCQWIRQRCNFSQHANQTPSLKIYNVDMILGIFH